MQHTLDLTTQLGDGIVQIRLPMSGNPLRYVNAYLLEDDDGYTLVDCGWKADDVFAALRAGLAASGIGLGDIARLLVTHAHFDHYGLAATLRRAGVPDLQLHRADWEFAQLLLEDSAALDRAADAWIARNGLLAGDAPEEDVQYHRSELAEATLLLEDGDPIGRLRAVWTPGHSPGHVCFADSRSGMLLAGDHILDPITPHVGVWSERREDPLGAYIASLHKVAKLGATGVLPAHGEPFADLARRTRELLAHEDTREAQVIAVIERSTTDATTVARAIPWTRRNRNFGELSPAHQQFAVAETLAHLEYARERGVVTRNQHAIPYTYARC